MIVLTPVDRTARDMVAAARRIAEHAQTAPDCGCAASWCPARRRRMVVAWQLQAKLGAACRRLAAPVGDEAGPW